MKLAHLVSAPHVLLLSDGLKVGRIDAVFYPADVVENEPLRDGADQEFIGVSVREDQAAVCSAPLSISLVNRSGPEPARIGLLHSPPEPFVWRRGGESRPLARITGRDTVCLPLPVVRGAQAKTNDLEGPSAPRDDTGCVHWRWHGGADPKRVAECAKPVDVCTAVAERFVAPCATWDGATKEGAGIYSLWHRIFLSVSMPRVVRSYAAALSCLHFTTNVLVAA